MIVWRSKIGDQEARERLVKWTNDKWLPSARLQASSKAATPAQAKKRIRAVAAACRRLARQVTRLRAPADFLFSTALAKAKFPIGALPRRRGFAYRLERIAAAADAASRQNWRHLRGEAMRRKVAGLARKYKEILNAEPSGERGSAFHALASAALAELSSKASGFDRLIAAAVREIA